MFGGKNKPTKEEWLREAEKAYQEVFGQRDKSIEVGRPLTFSEIEEEAVREGNRLARWLLEEKISIETENSGCHGEQCFCPHCGKPAKRKREDLETRRLQARPGAVSFGRYEYHCCSCRRSFFPSGHPVEAED
jgi:hypothetical protein